MKRLSVLAALLLWLVAANQLFAKGPVDRIVIVGPNLMEPVEITGANALEEFSPWTGGFLDETRGETKKVPGENPVYIVFSYLKGQDGILRLAYVFYYVPPSRSGQRGLIYIPGGDQPWWMVNSGTIIRTESRKWLYASGKWDAAASRALTSGQASTRPLAVWRGSGNALRR